MVHPLLSRYAMSKATWTTHGKIFTCRNLLVLGFILAGEHLQRYCGKWILATHAGYRSCLSTPKPLVVITSDHLISIDTAGESNRILRKQLNFFQQLHLMRQESRI